MHWEAIITASQLLSLRGFGRIQVKGAQQLRIERDDHIDSDISTAATLIGSMNPIGASTPAASGTDSRLYPAAHHRFCRHLR